VRVPGLWRRGRLRSLYNLSCSLYFRLPRYRYHIPARLDSGGGGAGAGARVVRYHGFFFFLVFFPVNGVFTTPLQKSIDHSSGVVRATTIMIS